MNRQERTRRNELIRNDLGRRIQALRQQRALTQGQLAEMVDVTEKHISRIEQGISFPSIAVLMELATVLGVDVQSVLFGSGGRDDDSRLGHLQALYAALSENGRAALAHIADEIYALERRLINSKE